MWADQAFLAGAACMQKRIAFMPNRIKIFTSSTVWDHFAGLPLGL
jgi:hypothetical protein